MINAPNWRTNLLQRHHWVTFLLPFAVFMLVGSLEPTPKTLGGQSIGLAIPYTCYPLVYAAKIALTLAAIAVVWPGYREFPLRVSPLAMIVGAVGGVLWVGLCLLDCEHRYVLPFLNPLGLGWLIGAGSRSAFNPFQELAGHPVWAWTFLGVRFLGLVIVVPIIEEFFLRGFVMRFVVDRDWWDVPFGKANRLAIVLGTAVPMLMHPGELLAAALWFSLITWLMLRTRNIWDCIAAHAITNLILGVYVVYTNTPAAWRLM
jgi:uncharacterized protein